MSIRWITASLGTAPALAVQNTPDINIIDVRDLVDKAGNRAESVRLKIEQGVESLRSGKKTVICCDYGISRSNAIAAGVLSVYEGISLEQAVRKVQDSTGEKEIKLEPLMAVRAALGTKSKHGNEAKRSVLVTGGGGFIGRSLLPMLEQDFTVVAPSRDLINLESGSTQLDLLVGESGADCIVHLANPRIYTSNVAFGSTMTMLRNVIDVCLSRDVRLIYLSGWEVYSGYRGNVTADESLPLFSKGPYGDSKYLAEVLLEHSKKNQGLKCSILRSGPVYGVHADKPKFIYNFINKALRNEPIVTHRYRNGNPALDLMCVEDLVSAIVQVVKSDTKETFNLGTGVLTETVEIATLISGILGSSSLISSTLIDSDTACISMDSSKAFNTFGWKPQVDLNSGVMNIIEFEKGKIR